MIFPFLEPPAPERTYLIEAEVEFRIHPIAGKPSVVRDIAYMFWCDDDQTEDDLAEFIEKRRRTLAREHGAAIRWGQSGENTLYCVQMSIVRKRYHDRRSADNTPAILDAVRAMDEKERQWQELMANSGR